MVLALFDQLMAKIKSNDKAHVAFCVSGIIGCLVCYGVLQVGGECHLFGRSGWVVVVLVVLVVVALLAVVSALLAVVLGCSSSFLRG